MTAPRISLRAIAVLAAASADPPITPLALWNAGIKTARVTVTRQIACHVARQMTDCSLKQIARIYGGLHHTTVWHADRVIAARRAADPALDARVSLVERQARELAGGS